MPINPKKNEGKQDFLKRCTIDETSNGMNSKAAYAACNSAWDNARNQRAALSLSVPVELQDSQDNDKPKTFLITAYTGQPVETWYRKLIIEVKGIQTKAKIPILREHLRERIVGSGKTWKKDNILYAEGAFSQKTDDGKEVKDLAEEGYPWQASIQVVPLEIKVLRNEKESAKVNGFEIEGPAEIWLKSKVGEVSFVSLGADDETAAIAMDDNLKSSVKISYSKILKKEKKIMNLQELTAEYPDLIAQIREEGVKSVDLAAAKNEAVQTEKERILGLAKIQFGEETSKKFEAIVESNVTVAQFEAVSAINPAPEPKKADTQAAMLEAIHKAGAENPGANAGEAGEGGSGKDYMSQVNEHKLLMKCSTTDAMQAVMKKDPAAHEAYLASVN